MQAGRLRYGGLFFAGLLRDNRFMQQTHDLNVLAESPLITPRDLKSALPMTPEANATVVAGRDAIKRILRKEDARLVIIVGPCSIHDEKAAFEYAERLRALQRAGGRPVVPGHADLFREAADDDRVEGPDQ